MITTKFRLMLILLLGFISFNNIAQGTDLQPLYQLEIEGAGAIAWSPDGEMLAVRDTSGIRFYTPELEFIQVFEQPSEQVKTLAWSPNGEYIATVGFDANQRGNTIYVWDVENQELLTIFDEHSGYVPTISWDNNSETIATGSWDKRVLIWDPTTGEILNEIDMSIVSENFSYPNWIVSSMDSSTTGEELAVTVPSVGIYYMEHTGRRNNHTHY